MDFQETYAKIQRLLAGSVFGIAVFALVILFLMLFVWLPWPLALLSDIGTISAIVYLRKRWIAHRRATPVYQPPARVSLSAQPDYQQGYQARTSSDTLVSRITLEDYQPQPKEASPGLVYEEPLVQYPD